MLGKVRGDARGWNFRDNLLRIRLLDPFNPLLDIANRRKVLVQLTAVVTTQSFLKALRVAEYKIQNAAAILLLTLPLCRIFLVAGGSEQSLEYRPGADLGGFGVFSVRHEMLLLYAQLYPLSQLPPWMPSSQPSSSEPKRVLFSSWRAAI
jgi:hypothetical protein